jgi:quinol-cytochrome oxidoreductase complex cytochrome b subunit
MDPAESNVVRLGAERISTLHPNLTVSSPWVDGSASTQASDQREGELWRIIAWICLVFLVCESLWGARLGRRRGRLA